MKMIGPVEKKPSIRIAGYLEKKGKTRLVMCRWKRWWFVLEGRLLLYYKSQLEYLNLSPCRGSLNLGLASTVRPGKRLELTVVTRSQSVTLKAANKVDHEQWLQSLVDAMALPYYHHNYGSRPVMHFRYATQDYHDNLIDRVRHFRSPVYSVTSNENSTNRSAQSGSCETSTSSSHSSSIGQSQSDRCLLRRVFSDSRATLQRPYRLRGERNSARLGKITLSDTSIPVSARATYMSRASSSDKCQSMQELRIGPEGMCNKDNAANSEKNWLELKKITNGSKESKLNNSIKIELNLEDTGTKSGEEITEQKISNIKITFDGCAIYGSRKSSTEKVPVEIHSTASKKQATQELIHNVGRKLSRFPNNKEVKSDSHLSMKKPTRTQSMSCDNMQTLDRSIGSTYKEVCAKLEVMKKEQSMSQTTSPHTGRKTNKKRSNSILSRFIDSKTGDIEHGDSGDKNMERQRTVKKRLSFLRKIWKTREKSNEEEDEEFDTIEYESIPVVIELPNPEVQEPEQLLSSLRQEEMVPAEPPPDYDVSIAEELEVPPSLPPRQRYRPASPWHDVPQNNQPVSPPEDDPPPPLPAKTKKHKPHQLLIKIEQDTTLCQTSSDPTKETSTSPTADGDLCEPLVTKGSKGPENPEALAADLPELNTDVPHPDDQDSEFTCNFIQVTEVQEPIYDVPRPHISLIATIQRQSDCLENFTATHFLCTTPLVDVDSLDPVSSRLDAEMTPDSLECDSPWSLANGEFHFPSRSDSSHTSLSLQRHFLTAEDKLFPDSLNS